MKINYELKRFMNNHMTEKEEEMEKLYMGQMDEAYKEYSELRSLYEKLIKLEYDHHRKFLLTSCLDSLNEDNK